MLCVTEPVFSKIASTVSPQGVAAVFLTPKYITNTDDTRFQRIFVCENVSDPGNLGNIMRSAEAFDFCELILVGRCADPYNEKVLRSSMGACFRLRIRQESSCEQWDEDELQAAIEDRYELVVAYDRCVVFDHTAIETDSAS